VVTDPHTHTNTQTNAQTEPITIQCTAKLSAQCNKLHLNFVATVNDDFEQSYRKNDS